MKLTLEQALSQPITELMKCSPMALMQYQRQIDEALGQVKAQKAWIDGVLNLKYGHKADEHRHQHGKDTGTVHFDDRGVTITADLPKKPTWDQTKLAEIAARIAASGDNPAEFLDITYKVAERKYTAWPEHLRKAFEPARTLATGKATYRLAASEESEQ